MYVSFTDWEFDGDVDKTVEGIKANWAFVPGPVQPTLYPITFSPALTRSLVTASCK